MKIKRDTAKKLLKVTGITILAFILSLILYQPFSFSTTTIMPTGAQGDFNITDYYSAVADTRAVRTLDNNIVVVDIRDCSRNEIAEALEYISYFEPAAVGLDVVFVEPRDEETDEYLLNVVNSYTNLVLPVILDKNDTTDLFSVKEECFFATEVEAPQFGAVNLPSLFQNGTKREFPTYFAMENGDTIESFVSALIKEVDPDAYFHLRERGKQKEYINYPSRTYRTIKGDLSSIIENDELIKNKIVLVGSVNDIDDIHSTPVNMRMSGILIHAYALSTILDRNYLDTPSSFVSKGLAFILCFFVVSLTVFLTTKAKGIFLRLVQLMLLIVTVIAGYLLFLKQNWIIDPSYTVLILTFGLLACDLWAAGEALAEYLRRKKQQKLKDSKPS